MTTRKKPNKRQKVTKQTTEKTTVALVPQPHGGALKAGGTPGNAGGGRPPNWLRDKCDELLADKDSWSQVEDILKDKDHALFATMWKAVADRAAGKPKEIVESSGQLTVKVVYSNE